MTPENENGAPAEWVAPSPGIPAVPTEVDSSAGAQFPEDVQRAIDIARKMIKAGMAVFAAAPCPTDCPGHTDRHGNHVPHNGGPGQYHLPYQWDKTVPSEVWLDPANPKGFRPGWGLAAVGGRVADFLDVDPRNGGQESLTEIRAAGHMPDAFGRQSTPSGGDHYVIAPTGERKSTGFMPGLDLQAGAPDGQGRGFVWIAPTVRPSKDPARLGELVAYRWIEEPDFAALEEYGQTAIDSTQGIRDRIVAKRSAPRERPAPAGEPRPDAHSLADPFLDASVKGGAHGESRSFTTAEAMDFCRPSLTDVQAAKLGTIEETANTAAATLSHFVPAFWTADEAMALIETALGHTAYDPNGPSNWTAEKFRPVLDGRRPPRDNWKAERRPDGGREPETEGSAVGEAEGTKRDWDAELSAALMHRDQWVKVKPPTPLVRGLLNLNSESWMIGASGSFKSFVALDIAGHVVTGQEWRGRKVHRGKALYLAAEGSEGVSKRAAAWEKTYGTQADDLFILPIPVQVKGERKDLLSEGWRALIRLAVREGFVLIVIDTQARVTVGLEENSSTEMGLLTEAVRLLKEKTGACVLVVHHTGRNGGDARGSSAIDGAQDSELKVQRADPRDSLRAKLLTDKQKDMAETKGGIPLQLVRVELGIDEEGEPIDSLAIEPYDPFLVPDPTEGIPTWRRDLDGVKLEIMSVMVDQASTEIGATHTEIRAWINERRKDAGGEHKPVPKQSYASAIKVLCGEADGKGPKPPALLVRNGVSRVVIDQAVRAEQSARESPNP